MREIKISDTWSEIHYEDNPDFVPKWNAPNFMDDGAKEEHALAASEVVLFEVVNRTKHGSVATGIYKAVCPCCGRHAEPYTLALHAYWMFDLDWLEAHGKRNRFACDGCRPLAVVEKNGISKTAMMEAIGAPETFLLILAEDVADPNVIVD